MQIVLPRSLRLMMVLAIATSLVVAPVDAKLQRGPGAATAEEIRSISQRRMQERERLRNAQEGEFWARRGL
ncbi:hypothetical protein SDRG_00749 [Saprolegnia diclina VS20]|uniref:RxLR effector protein n=1 Tax=Saprolegnia diclina (strain VS20) TaxID=1156394 RepID=T0S989_SAPDV|nr:hypothetical protein SDRG_00749 [Saprolegnia diclina VS20]EQC41893.1 hypothetical protein SDRG_00749 [Saprolegnia diclina VS20]|eukprot:XP_008604462.1 hypothetical protein SDRG_00749 [Saprolegnia diclina VS20]